MRVCPECDRQSSEEICPACGTRTLLEAPSDPGIDPLLGRVFEGRYRLESLIGRGGMGAVYQATQITMNKVVAVKVVKPEFAANTEAAKRFHREAKAASSLSHPHTIRVFDFGQTPQRELYMAMEFLDGCSLGKLLRERERLPLQRTLKIVAEIASSLVEAHERGLVHRDLKPENVILLDLANDRDFVKVLDFGIAKFLSGSSGDSTVTRTGAVIGTPQYMAPEQARASRSLSTAADVYSLGVIFYEMLTGALPFAGDSPIDMLMAHVNQPVPDLPTDLDVPDDVRMLVGRMLAKEPNERPTASDVARELEEVRDREKVLSYMARRGTQEGAAVPPSETATIPRPARSVREERFDETAVVDVALPGTSSDAVAPESLELIRPLRSGGKALWLAGGLMLVAAAIGLAVWLLRVKPAEPVVEVSPTQHQVQAPRAEEKPVSPTPIETAKPIEVTTPVIVQTPEKPAATTTDVATPAPAIATSKPAEPKPMPTTVKAKPAESRPKPAAPRTTGAKPAAPKAAVPAQTEESDDRTPAVW